MNTDIADTRWVRSSLSKANGNCVEVAGLPGVVAVRDSKDPAGPVLAFDGSTWGKFAARLQRGRDVT